jgi:hypothetical protein
MWVVDPNHYEPANKLANETISDTAETQHALSRCI